MYKIILVDDEVNAIEGMKILIDTKRNNISEILSSTNAIEALKIIDAERPDIIISDIAMPQMTGLEMIAEIKKIENYNPMIVILSGYSTFSYAQTAMAHGVRAYLLKPVDEDELNDKLDELIGEIEANSQQTFEKDIVLEGALLKIMNGDRAKKTVSSFMSLLGCEEDDKIILAVSEIIYKQNREIELSEEELDGDFEKLKGIFEKVFSKSFRANSFRFGENKMLSIIWGKTLSESEISAYYKSFSSLALNALAISLPVEFSKVLGSFEEFETEVKKLTDTTVSAPATENVNEPSLSGAQFKEVNDMFLNISTNFEVLYKEELQAQVEKAIDKAIEINASINEFSTIFGAFLVNISNFVAVENNNINDILARANLISKNKGGLPSLKNTYVNFVMQLYDTMTNYNDKLQNETFHNIITYVNNKYTENLTLKSLASRFYVNPIYLGRVFKKQTGTLFNEYLTTLRIEKSKVLLNKTTKKVYEIASEIGFNDPNYFIAKFLKSEGITPSQYRKQNKE